MKKRLVSALLIVLLIFSTSCRTLMNPHVRPADQANKRTSLANAIQYAESVQEKYRRAAGDQAKFGSWLGTLLIPVGAAATFIGATSSSTGSHDALLGLTLGAASAFAAGNRLRSKPRNLIYFRGSRAVGCAISASLPFQLTGMQESEFRKALYGEADVEPGLPQAIADVHSSAERVEAEIAALEERAEQGVSDLDEGPNPYVVGVKDYLGRIADFEVQARDALREAKIVDKRIATAGSELVNAVSLIQDRVHEAIEATLPDLQSINGVLDGLLDSAKRFGKMSVQTPDPPAEGAGTGILVTEAGEVDPLQDLRDEVGKLIEDVNLVERKVLEISSTVDSIEGQQTSVTEQDCGVEIEAPRLRVLPSNVVTIQLGDTNEHRLVIAGGQPLYFASLLDKTEGLEVTSESEGGGAFVVIRVVDPEKLSARTYNAFVYDSTGTENGTTVQINVEAGSESEVSGSSEGEDQEEQNGGGQSGGEELSTIEDAARSLIGKQAAFAGVGLDFESLEALAFDGGVALEIRIGEEGAAQAAGLTSTRLEQMAQSVEDLLDFPTKAILIPGEDESILGVRLEIQATSEDIGPILEELTAEDDNG